jgi:hypothetical protein
MTQLRKLGGKQSPPVHIYISHTSPVLAETRNSSFPGIPLWGKESLALFRLCKHLKSHFIFPSMGRMPPSQEAS